MAIANLHSSQLNSKSISELNAIADSHSGAKQVNMSLNGISRMKQKRFTALKAAFLQAEEVDLGDNHLYALKDSRFNALGNIFGNKVTKLGLAHNHLYHMTVAKLEALGHTFPHVTTLDLTGNSLDKMTLEQLEALGHAFPRVTTLDLSDTCLKDMTSAQLEVLGRAFPLGMKFNLGDEYLDFDSSEQLLAFLKKFPSAQEISLEGCEIRESVFDGLIEKLTENNSLIAHLTGLGYKEDELNQLADARRVELREPILKQASNTFALLRRTGKLVPDVERYILSLEGSLPQDKDSWGKTSASWQEIVRQNQLSLQSPAPTAASQNGIFGGDDMNTQETKTAPDPS